LSKVVQSNFSISNSSAFFSIKFFFFKTFNKYFKFLIDLFCRRTRCCNDLILFFDSDLDEEELGSFGRLILNNEWAHDTFDGDEFCFDKLHSWIFEVDSSGEIILTEVVSSSVTQSPSLSISTKYVDVKP